MHPDDDSQTTLSKWPFILGDVLLVATALAIAILGDWQLTDWQVAACVAAVALGAALFVLPYTVEFQVRVGEVREDQAAELHILEKHLLSVEQSIDSIYSRLGALEAAMAEIDSPDTDAIAGFEAKLLRLEAACSDQDECIDVLRVEFQKLASKERAPSLVPEILKQIERPKREARERHGPEESRLLRRAITENGDPSSAAVSRIIESKGKLQEEAEVPAVEEELCFEGEKITGPVKRTRVRKGDAVVTASVFIGIGNKPYLRGDGAGLSREKGIAMEFQEIGKWRWVASEEFDTSIEVQIYRNDADPDKSGKYDLAPGEKLEIRPIF